MSTARIIASAAGVAASAVVGYFMMKNVKFESKHPHPPPIRFDNQISETESTKQLQFDDSKVAEPNLSVDMAIDTSNEEKRDQDIIRACRAIYPPFLGSQAADSDFKVKQIQGGITNQLFRVALGHQCCLFRIYGPKTELIIDRDIENQVMALLTERNFGAAVYGHVRNGRVEQWLPGASLKPEEMCLDWLMPKIAARLAEMHSMDMPLNRQPSLWRVLDKWLTVALGIDFPDNPTRQQQLRDINLPQVAQELASLKSKLLRVNSPIVFAHNDLLSGNIMYDKASDRVTIIDYEYGAYNYRGFDIANHFCECCGFDCNWDQFPNKERQLIFMRGYLNQSLGREPSEGELEALYQEVQGFVLAAHMFWGIWAIVQSKHSPVDFDFLSYSVLRLNGFKLMKDRCCSFLPGQ